MSSNSDGQVAMDCRIGNNYNMQVRLYFFPMNLEQPNQILQLATTSAFVTGLYGIVRNTPRLGILVGTAAINSGITAGTFFSEPEMNLTQLFFSY